MRIYLIKRKFGAINWSKLYIDRELTFSDGVIIHAGKYFIRKKDAKKYLQSMEYPEYYEVVGATIDKLKKLV